MESTDVSATEENSALYRAVVDEAIHHSHTIMGALIEATRQALRERELNARNLRDAQGLVESRQYLNRHEALLLNAYPKALEGKFQAGDSRVSPAATATVQFHQIELMDEGQVSERVALARAQQVVIQAVENQLVEFNLLMSSLMGLSSVRPERNPLRPMIYVRALHAVVLQMRLSEPVQQDWLWHMSEALGATLNALYARLSVQLRGHGVQTSTYVMKHVSLGTQGWGGGQTDRRGTGRRAGDLAPVPAPAAPTYSDYRHESLLTLDKLRRLLSGELKLPAAPEALAAPTDLESFAQQFARQFENPEHHGRPDNSDFDVTVPAALEALQEMKQVDRVIERMGNRQIAQTASVRPTSVVPQPVAGASSLPPHPAHALGQVLSLEVVTLIVDNMSSDARLLKPVQQVIKALEPALRQLALIDPRFFSNKQHPARRLLQEVTDRSLAYNTVEMPGFAAFEAALHRLLGPLMSLQIEDAQPFEQVLQQLIQAWDERKPPSKLAHAVEALQHAEKRNLLAEKIARDIEARPDAAQIPSGVLDFLCGPWAQVVAHARLTRHNEGEDPGHYGELALALIWSVQPELTSKNISKLTRLVSKMLAKLREGLDLIDYPSVKTSAFFDQLMKLHQQAFRPASVRAAAPAVPAAAKPVPAKAEGLLASLLDDANPWVAPAEAKASGFMELMEEPPRAATAPAPLLPSVTVRPVASFAPTQPATLDIPNEVAALADVVLPVGAWVELQVNGVWMRTQLSWASPHGTLFLFTNTYGQTKSMTRRLRDKMFALGSMRMVSAQPLVDDALDAVAQTAMRNSMDVKP